jgi:integrase
MDKDSPASERSTNPALSAAPRRRSQRMAASPPNPRPAPPHTPPTLPRGRIVRADPDFRPHSPALPTTARLPRVKPKKPYPSFPLFPHATGRWAKKIRGRFVFFGPWEDAQGALDRFLEQEHALRAGLVPRVPVARPTLAPDASITPGTLEAGSACTLRHLVNHFLTAKKQRLDTGEMSPRSFDDYHTICGRLISFFGVHRLATDIRPEDFGLFRAELAKTRGALALGADITKVRAVFKHGYESMLIDRPVRFGQQFDKPPKRAVRMARSRRGERMFEPAEIKKLLSAASPQLKAMILLGLNCGMGNTDLATLPQKALNLRTAMLTFPRPKTGVARRAPLWAETVEALKAAAKLRPDAKQKVDSGLVFITKYGAPWVRVQAPKAAGTNRTSTVIDGIGLEFGKVMRSTKTYQPGRGFYALRHTFRTVADEVGDRLAIDLIMGHENARDMGSQYVERIGDERLQRVVEHVRAWAFESCRRRAAGAVARDQSRK